MRIKSSLADPQQLQPIEETTDVLQIIIETPRGSRNKYAFDSDQKIFSLKKVLPAGMVFPCDFGFIPRTLAEDGDPIDVLVLMDEPVFPGCLLRSRLIGVIEGEQTEGRKHLRNDRLLAVAEVSHLYADVRRFSDLPQKFLHELEEFFVNYLRLEGKRYKLLGFKDANTALSLVRKARKSL